MESHPPLPLREAAILLLAGRRPARKRARDQQADRAGGQLREELLRELIDRDPAPDALEEALLQIVTQSSSPHGSLRAVAISLRDELLAVQATPLLAEHLMDEISTLSVRQSASGKHRVS